MVENKIYEERKGKSVSVGTHISKIQLELAPKEIAQPKHYLNFYQAIVNSLEDIGAIKTQAHYWQ